MNFKTVSDYYVILAEVDCHSERTGELVSLEKDCNEIEDLLWIIYRAICTAYQVCEFVYRYNIPENIRSYKGTVLVW